jgi:integrase
MTIRKEPSGRFRAILKSHSHYVAGRTFDTRREAQAWLTRELAALSGGIDPRVGRATVRALFPVWLEQRKDAVSSKTYTADCAVIRLTPTAVAALSIGAVTDRDVSRALLALTRKGLAEASVRRYLDSLSSFFGWAVHERLIAANPVTPTRVPKSPEPRTEMYPFGEHELERVYRRAAGRNQRLADIMLVGAWTGLRWSELRAIRVRDFIEVPMPILIVQQAQPEGVRVKRTKSRRTRRVPVADRVLPIVRDLAAGREPDDRLCVTATGHQLHATAFKRTLAWEAVGEGRRIHDLRH